MTKNTPPLYAPLDFLNYIWLILSLEYWTMALDIPLLEKYVGFGNKINQIQFLGAPDKPQDVFLENKDMYR